MATGSEVFGSYAEGISVKVRRNVLKMILVCLGFSWFVAQCLIVSDVRQR
jgi:hypothetical protein